jgi:hypothetical protein
MSMRRTMLSLTLLAGLSMAGVHCASANADTPPARGGGGDGVLERRPPVASPHIEVVDDTLRALPTFGHAGRWYVLGETGQRYLVRVVNPTPARLEAVVSVDGLDAVDGGPASFGKRGYIIPAYGDVTIDGWRTSLDAVAAFRFSSVADSYAGRKGRDRNVGVIGVAFFRERAPVAWQPPQPLQERGRAAPSPAADAAGGAPASAPARKSASSAAESERPGLGTQYGESQQSHVVETTFTRADASPMMTSEVRYDDRAGLISRGIQLPVPGDPRDAENQLRDTAQAFPDSRFAQPPP